MANRVYFSGYKIKKENEEKLRRAALFILRHRGYTAARLEITFLGDAVMRLLKKKYLPKKAGPANTLSFHEPKGFPHPEEKGLWLGEILLNKDLTKGSYEALLPLLIHSFLHLEGYRHDTPRDMMTMERSTQKFLEILLRKERS